MPTDYMDMSRGVGNLGVVAQQISQQVAQQRFRQAVLAQQFQQRQQALQQQAQVNAVREQLMQEQMGTQRAQQGALGARQGYDTERTLRSQEEAGNLSALRTAINAAFARKGLTDEFNPLDEPVQPDFTQAAAISSQLPDTRTKNLMQNLAQAQTMSQSPNMMNLVALGQRNPIVNTPAGAAPNNLITGVQGPPVPRTYAPGSNDSRLKELATWGNIFKAVSDAEPGDATFPIFQQATNRLTQLQAPTVPPVQGGQAPLEAPRDPAQRQAGAVYVTPKGLLKWTGTGWVQP